MPSDTEPLRFPEHYPPKERWKKFFLGVRWLGPDLSFFKTLKALQGARSADQMQVWGNGLHREIAETVAVVFHQRLRWPTPVFLPSDQFSVMCHGPKFETFDDYALEEAIEALELKLGITLDRAFWAGMEDASFQQVVDKIAQKQAGA